VGEIGSGLLVYLGIGRDDQEADLLTMTDKVCNLRVFSDADGKMNLSVLDRSGELLVVSQFTLYGDARKGRRPSYSAAAEPNRAKELYEKFLGLVRGRGLTVRSGVFQETMEVESVNDGPVTILLDSTRLF
jgi:D-tyrosyl-tRNA(Tyr) deacylase